MTVPGFPAATQNGCSLGFDNAMSLRSSGAVRVVVQSRTNNPTSFVLMQNLQGSLSVTMAQENGSPWAAVFEAMKE